MNNIERRARGLPYIVDADIVKQQKKSRALLQKLNTWDASDFDGLQMIVAELLGRSDNAFITPPFFCDYGFNIEAGKDFYANFNCTILDVAKVTIGDFCKMGPNSAIYTAGHPIHPDTRRSQYEYGIPVAIGNDVWIGANAVILPGVTIGDGCVIGAGSVVTHDIPSMSLAVGSPCRVVRKITEEDRRFYFRDRRFDAETWKIIEKRTKQ